jgi:AcrR family transcriptional regulator
MSYHHGNLPSEVTLAAMGLIEESGVENLSLRHVAKICGVSATAVYRHFASKEQLLMACATEGYRRLAHEMRARSEPYENDTREALVQLGVAYLAFAFEHKKLFTFMFNADLARASFEQLEIFSQSFLLLQSVAAKGVEQGLFKGDVDVVTLKAWSLVHGLATLVITNRIPVGGSVEYFQLAAQIFAGSIE